MSGLLEPYDAKVACTVLRGGGGSDTSLPTRLREASLKEATPTTRGIHQKIFGDRDPVAEPGTAMGSRGDYWTTLAVVPNILKMSADTVFALLQPGGVLDPRYRELAILRTARKQKAPAPDAKG